LLALCAFISSAKAQSNPPRPNIVVMLADELGYGNVSFNGCPDYPFGLGMDRLAMIFVDQSACLRT
jgi:arylsulfatase A-like enzyme